MNMAQKISLLVIMFFIKINLIFLPLVMAKVTGVCSNCHTMHNSQDGQPIVKFGGWDPSNGQQTGSISDEPQEYLLISNCIGCHTNAVDDKTIITIGPSGGESYIPIVYNASVEPNYPEEPTASGSSNALAGGNFYWIEHDGDEYGHNVISRADSLLTEAPGRNQGCTDSCHYSLYQWRFPWPNSEGQGCPSCHTPAHHKGGSSTAVADEEDGWYRFLGKKHSQGPDRPILKGLEDPDWQQTVSPADHNEYWDTWDYGPGNAGISKFCAACHGNFHSTRYGPWAGNGGFKGGPGGGWHTAPWFRHPAGIFLPDFGESSKYNTDGSGDEGVPGSYNPVAPVSRQDVDSYSAPSEVVTVGSSGDMVSCISCHRAHASPYPDMLRWNYDTCQASTANSDCGCFICHTRKDE